MQRPKPPKYQELNSYERFAAIKSFCRKKYPLKITAARIKAEKERPPTPLSGAERCKSPPEPPLATAARRSTCATCAAFAVRDALRTATARAQSVRGRGRGRGRGLTAVPEVRPRVEPLYARMRGPPRGGTDVCKERMAGSSRGRGHVPARGPLRYENPKCQEPTILAPTVSDPPWGGTPGKRLAPDRPPLKVRLHPLERRPKSSPEYWQREFERLDDEIRGPLRGVRQMWDALTPTILHRVAPILGIPMPTAGYQRENEEAMPTEFTPPSADKSDPIPFWDEVSLPEEVPKMNVVPSEDAFRDWQFADIPERRTLGMMRTEKASLQRAVLPQGKQLAPIKENRGERILRVEIPIKADGSPAITVQVEPPEIEETVNVTPRGIETIIKETTTKQVKKTDAYGETAIETVTSVKTTKKIETYGGDMLTETYEPREEGVEYDGRRDSDETRQMIKVHESFADFHRQLEEDLGEAQSQDPWYTPMRKEEEGEYAFHFGEFVREKKKSADSWGGELFITDSYLEARRAYVGTEQLELEMSEILDMINVDLDVHPPTLYPRDEGKFICPGRPNNPYYNFIHKPVRKAAVWREHFRPETTGEAMDTSVLLHPGLNLPEKAKHVTSKITSEFLDWLLGLGGVQQSELTEEVIQQLFDVTFDLPAARSLCVRVKEMPVVTKQVADTCFALEAEEQEGLRREVHKDLSAEKKKRHVVAFDKHLERCCPQRFYAPKNKVRETWIECRVPQDLATSRIVFEGITHLVSVQRFCEWLDRHPDHEAPEFLRTVAMVGPDAQRFRARGGQSVRFQTEEQPTPRGSKQRKSRSHSLRRTHASKKSIYSRTDSAFAMMARSSSGKLKGNKSGHKQRGADKSSLRSGSPRERDHRVSVASANMAKSVDRIERLHRSLTAARSQAVL